MAREPYSENGALASGSTGRSVLKNISSFRIRRRAADPRWWFRHAF